MRTRARRIVLILAATFAAACGDDGGSDERIVTPTSTPTPLFVDEPCFMGSTLTTIVRTLPGSHLDAGWTGVWHGVPTTSENELTADLLCAGGRDCTIDGSNLVGRTAGVPLPLSAGGVSLCVLTSFREPVFGTYDCNGCASLSAKLSVRVFPAEDADAPCPTCVGDPTPNDGRKRGTCRGGSSAGAPCDVGALGKSATDAVSKDCLPSGSVVDDVGVDLNPLSTTIVSAAASLDCVSPSAPRGSCFCPGQVRPNACEPDGVCPASGVCESGPIDSVCDGSPSRSCRSGTGAADCGARIPDAGTCVDRPRPCFGRRLTRTGACGTAEGVLVSLFCIPGTGAAAIDTMTGLPGPAAITLPVAVVHVPR